MTLLRLLGVTVNSQNLNERLGGRRGPKWQHGRAWFRYRETDEGNAPLLRIEWCFGKLGFGLQFVAGQNEEDDFVLGLTLPGAAFWIGTEGVVPRAWLKRLPDDPHTIGFSTHHGGLWWDCWQNDMEWHSGTPRWRHGNFTPMDALFGRMDYNKRQISVSTGVVPMPEKVYPCKVTMFESTWTRKRWRWWPLTCRMIRADVDVDDGVPHPGKGENSWDCGEDATYSLTCQADNAEHAIGQFVANVLRDRRKYGGANWQPSKVSA